MTKILSGRTRPPHPTLNDQDFDFEEGGKETMLARLATKLEKTKLELEILFAELQRY